MRSCSITNVFSSRGRWCTTPLRLVRRRRPSGPRRRILRQLRLWLQHRLRGCLRRMGRPLWLGRSMDMLGTATRCGGMSIGRGRGERIERGRSIRGWCAGSLRLRTERRRRPHRHNCHNLGCNLNLRWRPSLKYNPNRPQPHPQPQNLNLQL